MEEISHDIKTNDYVGILGFGSNFSVHLVLLFSSPSEALVNLCISIHLTILSMVQAQNIGIIFFSLKSYGLFLPIIALCSSISIN